jgi:ABC-type transport system involved in multi-copper enzyme maturation permease subunit
MLASLRRALSFPLLAKDLAERAARGRTYWTRLAFGVGLAGWFAVEMYRLGGGGGADPQQAGFALMGIGSALFGKLTLILCWAILLLQPAFMAGAITYEKERSSLDLLLLTNAPPAKLLLEKFLAGLVPMATLLLFGLPLGAVAYAYGGVTPAMLASAGAVLLGAWVQAGAFALLCSAWCRTTTAAIVASYLGLAGFYAATEWGLGNVWAIPGVTPAGGGWYNYPPLAGPLDGEETITWREKPWAKWVPHTLFPPAEMGGRFRTILNGKPVIGPDGYSIDMQLAPQVVEFEGFINYGSPIQSFSTNALGQRVRNVITPSVINQPIFTTSTTPVPVAVGWSSLAIRHAALPASGLLFLLLARVCLLRRAFTAPRRVWARVFAWLDGVLLRVNRRFGGVAFAQHAPVPPAGQPVLWREAHRGILGQPGHLLRIGAVWFIVLTLASLPAMTGFYALGRGDSAQARLHLIGGVAVIVAVFTLLSRAVAVMASERTHQTLEVLLTTPLRRREIVRQKARPLRWLALALYLPLCAMAGMAAWAAPDAARAVPMQWDGGGNLVSPLAAAGLRTAAGFQFPVSILALAVLLWQMRWLGVWCGLRIVSRGRAILTALGLVAAWVLAPGFAAGLAAGWLGDEWSWFSIWLRQASPTGLLELVVRGNLASLTITEQGTVVSAGAMMLNAGVILWVHAAIAILLRTACLARAEKHLHRA